MTVNLATDMILLCRAGSRVYGTNTDESDLDVKGVLIPPKQYLLGLQKFDQMAAPAKFLPYYDGEIPTEGTIYDLHKFVSLALMSNPNILDVLFCRDEDVLFASSAGRALRDARESFISRKAIQTFHGYAVSQLKRIKLHRRWLLAAPKENPTRKDFGLPDQSLIPKEHLEAAFAAVKQKTDSWEFNFNFVEDDAIRSMLVDEVKDTIAELVAAVSSLSDKDSERWRAACISIGLSDNMIEVMAQERKYRLAKDEWKSYCSWKKNRNPARAAIEAQCGFDCKHASHLVRLLRMGQEAVETGQINVSRRGIDADELLSIRQGQWTYDQLLTYAEENGKKLLHAPQAKLQAKPDYDLIEKLLMKLKEEK